MPLLIIKQNIAEIPCDAVVNATNTHLIPGGHGVDAAIHAAAGPGLLKECMKAGHVDIGGACITDAYSLPCKKIIHTAGPAWNGGSKGEIALLKSCYESALALCEEFGFESVAFPLISSGAMGFPRELVLKLAVDCITAHLDSLGEERELTVFIAVPDTSVYSVPDETERQLKSYLSSFEYRPLCEISAQRSPARSKKTFGLKKSDKKTAAGNAAIPKPHKTEDLALAEQIADYAPSYALELQSDDRMTEEDCALPRDGIPEDGNERRQKKASVKIVSPKTPEELVSSLDEGFAQKLTRLIDLKGMTDVECYKAANVSRQTWHKIISDKKYMPSKNTVISFSVALRLTLEETQALLKSTGFILSESLLFDRIVAFFLINGIYDIYTIDSELLKYDQPTLWKY